MEKKFAVSYLRISKKEQSLYSLDGQEGMNADFAKRNNIEIVQVYREDGRSAKNFTNRPEWQKLERFVSKNKKQIDYIIVFKYDRFSRNVMDALSFLDKAEKKLGIKVLSATEHIDVDFDSPMFFQYRTGLLLSAQVENMVIGERTKFAMWNALNQGRYMSKAPIGYKRELNEEGKSVLVVDEENANKIKQVFDLYLNGLNLQQIKVAVNLDLKGRSAIKRILEKSLYAGKVNVPAFKKFPPRVVKGIHEPIVSEEVFYEVQVKLGNVKLQPKKLENEDLPLRGVVCCNVCDHPLTGAKSKGKNKYYYYYKCNNCKGENHSTEKAHEELDIILSDLSLSPEVIEKVLSTYNEKLKTLGAIGRKELLKLEKEKERLKEKLSNLEEKYIDDKIEEATYRKWRPKIKSDLFGIEHKIKELETEEIQIDPTLILDFMENMKSFYEKANLQEKQEMINILFPQGISKVKNKGYRTPQLLEFIKSKNKKVRHLHIENNDNLCLTVGQSPVSTRGGT